MKRLGDLPVKINNKAANCTDIRHFKNLDTNMDFNMVK